MTVLVMSVLQYDNSKNSIKKQNSSVVLALPAWFSDFGLPFSRVVGVDRKMSLKDVPVLVPRTCECVALHGKGFKDFKIDHSGLSGGLGIITCVLKG